MAVESARKEGKKKSVHDGRKTSEKTAEQKRVVVEKFDARIRTQKRM